MTTYEHTLTLDDGEYITLEAALKVMVEHSDKEMIDGASAPYWAHKNTCNELLERLRSAPSTIASWNNFS